MLIPMIGVVQVGTFARADRFTYLPQIGLLITMIWGACALAERWKVPRPFQLTATASLIALSILLTVRQIHFWSDTETLFRHAVAVTSDNGMAQEVLGTELLEKRRAGLIVPENISPARRAEAIAHLREAARLLPDHADTHLNLGIALFDTKDHEEAADELATALRTMTFHAHGHFLLGLLLLEKGENPEAAREFEVSIENDPSNAVARVNLASLYRRQGRLDDAIAQDRAALLQDPDYADAHNNLGIALYQGGYKPEAVQKFQAAIRCDPKSAEARQNLNAAQQ